MTIKIKTDCPLGHTCEKTKWGVVRRCKWYIDRTLVRTNPETEKQEEYTEWECAMVMNVQMNGEVARQQRHVAAAIETFNNSMTKQNNQLAELMQQDKTLIVQNMPDLSKLQETDNEYN